MEGLLKSIDGFCARLNAGLLAVAVVLAVLVAAELTVRVPDLYRQAISAEGMNPTANANSNGDF